MKSKIKPYIQIFLCLWGIMAFGQRPAPAPKQSEKIAIINAIIHQGNGTVIENGGVVFENGIITYVGTSPDISGAKVVDAQQGHLYPGLILLNNKLGLVETESVKATIDFTEADHFNPEVRTLVAFNTDSHIIPTIRTNGILYTQPVLRGGLLNGTSSLLNLDGWNWEDAVISKDLALHLDWFSEPSIQEANNSQKINERKKKLAELQSYFDRAKVYKNDGYKDYKLEAIQPVLMGKKRLFISVDTPKEALETLKFIKENKIPYGVLVGDARLRPVLDDIKSSGVALVIRRIHSLPHSTETNPNDAYAFPKAVADKGILYALDYSGDMEAMGSRNLPFIAGTSVAYGVDKEQALQSISLNPAKILGVDNLIGTIEKGKRASFFLSKGDALNPLTNKVEKAYIDGRDIDLNNKQKTLYHRYQQKYAK